MTLLPTTPLKAGTLASYTDLNSTFSYSGLMTVSCAKFCAGVLVFFCLGGTFSSFFAIGFGEAAYLTIPPPSIWQLISMYPLTGGTVLGCMVTFTLGFLAGTLPLSFVESFMTASVFCFT
jgi:hypothetical protein